MMNDRPFRVGAIGTGDVFNHAHLLAYVALDSVQLAAICDSSPQATEYTRQNYLEQFADVAGGLADVGVGVMGAFNAVQQKKVLNNADAADIVIDVVPWLDKKAAAIACYRTQHALFFSAFPEAETLRDFLLMRCEKESLHRVWMPEELDETAFFGEEIVGYYD